jgi:CheY-like chemotaxis protein
MSPSTEMHAQVKNLLIEAQKRSVQETNRHTAELLANLSHELRTPLSTIIGFAELLHDDKVGATSARHKEYLGDILQSSHELVQLIDDVRGDLRRLDGQEAGIDVLAEEIQRIFVEFQRTSPPETEIHGHGCGRPHGGGAMRGTSILVVDDYPANLKLAQLLLQKAGYDVLTASDAEEALQVIEASVPGLILTDIRLPGIDGLELTRRLKANPATADIVVLAFTASATKDDEERALAAGCNGFISKPISTSLLPKLIAEKWHPAQDCGGGR